jgi:opacity protein-like surface antigen
MPRQGILLAYATAVALASAAVAAADPILKPRKYYGPVPPQSVTVRVGFLGGAGNVEMIEFLDGSLADPFEATSEDFGNGLTFDVGYMHKVHPQFGIRLNGSASLLRSTGEGLFVNDYPGRPDSVLAPQIDYQRTFDVDLFALELSAVYYFTDAAVKDFQPYIGGGFSLGVPHQKFEEVRTDHDTGETNTIASDQWSGEAGVHAVLGAFYYINNRFAVSTEGRLQMMQSRFPLTVANEFGQPEEVNFVVDYSGFTLALGVTWAF